MLDELKETLKGNALEYYRNALESEKREEHNTAVTLYFKTIASLCDLYILIKEGKIPSNHIERFRILETKYPKIYNIIDKDFTFYQDSYRARLNKEISSLLKNDAEKLFKLLDIEV